MELYKLDDISPTFVPRNSLSRINTLFQLTNFIIYHVSSNLVSLCRAWYGGIGQHRQWQGLQVCGLFLYWWFSLQWCRQICRSEAWLDYRLIARDWLGIHGCLHLRSLGLLSRHHELSNWLQPKNDWYGNSRFFVNYWNWRSLRCLVRWYVWSHVLVAILRYGD